MRKHGPDPVEAPPARSTRRARIHGLLFAGAALGTSLLTLDAAAGPKIPPFVGE
jgi:hypothetical protein